ncbi:Lactoylglutathione lyase / glyoxalase I family protein [Thalictrum thalictroides]|uniref:Lactoylglutathione lyase / glyoxalase I family protein n=1 Tax=Thalictrum thalictroides TaxID=46969 RepID=A0A7J6VS67_THATH|nr:Lactoylglutathione lyase / glyoxalase I family protein [Thalictrum thalictroides]
MAQENVVEAVSDVHNGGSENGKTKSVSFSAMKPQFIFQASKAADAIQFYKSAFGAEELNRDIHPKRKADQELPLILSAELKLASSIIVISDQIDDSAAPVKSDGTGNTFFLETNDVDGAVANAVKAGAKIEGEIVEGENSCCGARVAKVRDPYGYVWSICSGKKGADVEA